MSIGDPIREKGRELSGLARRLSEHLGGRDQEEWSESEITAMMHGLHQAVADLEEHLDLPLQTPRKGATGHGTGPSAADAAAPDPAETVEEGSNVPSQMAKVAIATRSLDPAMFAPEEPPSDVADETPDATVSAPEKPLDMSVLDQLGESDLKGFDVSKLQEKIAEDADYFKEFLGGIKTYRSPQPETPRWASAKAAVEGTLGSYAAPAGIGRPRSLAAPGTLASGIGGGAGYYADNYGEGLSVARSGAGSAGGAGPEGGGGDLAKEGADQAEATELEAFFTQVGRSLVSAQQQLDQRSQEYTAQLTAEGADPSMATLYRIPKVSAELKFAIENVSKKGINLLVHKAGSQSSVLNQQSVNFEIAAIPAPAGTLEAVRRQAPRLQLVLDSDLRQRVMEGLEATAAAKDSEAGDSTALEKAQKWLSSRPEKVLMIETGPTSGGYWLVRVATGEEAPGDDLPEGDQRLGLWHFTLGDAEAEQPPHLTPLFDIDSSSEQLPKSLVECLQALTERQASFLGSL